MRRRNTIVGEEFDLCVYFTVFKPAMFHGDELSSTSGGENEVIKRLAAAEDEADMGERSNGPRNRTDASCPSVTVAFVDTVDEYQGLAMRLLPKFLKVS